MKSTLFLLVSLVLTSVSSIAQEGKVFGKITDAETHEPLVGAHVVAEPTLITENISKEIHPKIITTDIEGKYTFQLPPGTWTIDVKYIGYERVRQRIKVTANSETEVSFSLNPEALGLELVTVSASKYEKKLGEESVSIQVLTPEFIQNNNAITLDEAIDKVPGVNMIGETVNIRGGAGYSANAGSRVLMLLDDVPWMTPHNSGIEFWALPLESIKQVEIIKGASSTFYGSAALNGTMNLITENPKQEPYYKILAFYGAYENPFKGNKKKYYWSDRPRMFNGFAFVHRRKFNDKFDLSLNTAFNRDESYLYNDEKNILRGFLKFRYRPTENLTIGVGTNSAYQYGDFYFIWAADTLPNGQVYGWNNTPTGDSLAYVLNEPDMHTFRYLPINIDPYLIFFDKRGHKHHFKGRYYYIKTRNSNNENTNAWLGYGEYNFHSRLRIKSVVFDFVTGASFSYSSVESAIFGKRNSTNAAAFFQMDTRLFDQLTLTCGIRGEIYKLDTLPLATAEHSLSGPVIFRLGANYAILQATHIRGSFGLGYRYPSIAEKYVNTIRANQYVIPNPELKPESSWSAELGFNQGFKLASWIGYIDLAGFVTQYDDMLEFTVAPNKEKVKYYPSVPPLFVFWSENISDTRISGLEVSAMGQGKIGNVTANLLLGYTYMHPIDRNYDPHGPDSLKYQGRSNILNWRFKHTAKGDMECSYKGFMVGFTTFINSFMENIDPLVELLPGVKAYREAHHGPTYSVDARVGYSLNEQTKLTFIAKNLTNKQNSIRPAYVEAPRNYTLQLSYEF